MTDRPAFWRRERTWIIVLYAATLALRLTNWRSPLFGDEAWHFYAARRLGTDVDNVHTMLRHEAARINHFFWWRPLFELLLAPAAFVSFEAWRFLHLSIVAALPVLGVLTLRALAVRTPFAYGVGIATATLPLFQRWGTIVFPDGLLTTAFAAGLLAFVRGRIRTAGVLFAAAMWIKEPALVGVGVLVAWTLWEAWRRREASFCPPVLGSVPTVLATAAAAGLVPLMVYLSRGGKPPGWSYGGDVRLVWEEAFVILWFVPLLVAGLVWWRTRLFSLLAFAYPAFYLYYRYFVNRGVENWYMVLPTYLVLLALALILHELHVRSRGLPWRHVAARALAVLVVFLILVQVVVPSNVTIKGNILSPLTGRPTHNLFQVIEYDNARENHILDVASHMAQDDWGTVFTIDMAWFFPLYPLAPRAETVRTSYSEWYGGGDPTEWVLLIEQDANATILGKALGVGRFNAAIQHAYADCIDYENDHYLLIHGQRCAGRAGALRAAYEQSLAR